MWQRITILVLLASITGLAGCNKGPVLLKAKGKVVKAGADFIPAQGEGLQIAFVPISADGKPPTNWYVAEVDQKTGTFHASGGHNSGMPPGQYRVAVELKKDRKDTLGGQYDALKSPFVFDVRTNSPLMVIDLNTPPLTGDAAVPANQSSTAQK